MLLVEPLEPVFLTVLGTLEFAEPSLDSVGHVLAVPELAVGAVTNGPSASSLEAGVDDVEGHVVDRDREGLKVIDEVLQVSVEPAQQTRLRQVLKLLLKMLGGAGPGGGGGSGGCWADAGC